jgi:hypothetical protein
MKIKLKSLELRPDYLNETSRNRDTFIKKHSDVKNTYKSDPDNIRYSYRTESQTLFHVENNLSQNVIFHSNYLNTWKIAGRRITELC